MATKAPPATPELETTNKASIWGALLSRTLPSYHGPLPVGVCDLELPVPHETFGTFRHKHLKSDAVAGLSLDTVLYSIFYPTTDVPTSKKVIWFPNPWQTIDGFIRMARRTPNFIYRAIAYPLAAAAIHGTTFPAKPNTPLREPPSPDKKWPLVIFSHGVGCSRLMYSSFCGELASRGYVVCAIEHRDGTSPSSVIVAEDGQVKNIHWLQWSDLYWPERSKEDQPKTDTILRHSQLKLRVREIYYAIDSMSRICNGQDVTVASVRRPNFDWAAWNGKVDTSKPIMTGHSLGGSAAILAGADTQFDFGGIVAFDPAIERLEPWHSPISAPLLIVNSEEFTKSSDFVRLQNLLEHAEQLAGVFSISGSTHPALSDVFLIIPSFISRLTGLAVDASHILSISVRTTLSFLNFGGLTGELSEADIEGFEDAVNGICKANKLVNGGGANGIAGAAGADGFANEGPQALLTVEGRGDYKGLKPGVFVKHVWDFSESGSAKLDSASNVDVGEGEAGIATA